MSLSRLPTYPLASLALALATVTLASGSSSAQVPETFTNLKVLPPDISRAELTATMRGFTEALGVRCSTCHVGEEGQPLSSYDFASDEKETKLKARQMLRMVKAINEEYLAALPERPEPNLSVTCMTCHGGVRRPEPIADLMQRSIAADGLDSAVSEYRQLRARYLGGRAYDFTEQPLLVLAQRLNQGGAFDQAMRVLDLNLELLPGSSMTYAVMGQLFEGVGDRAKAIERYTKALEVDPRNPLALQRLRVLKGS
jgi:Photosynthetic reaction centre cytochrome C subunit